VALLSELGDTRRFSSSKKAVRYAGLDVTVRSSDDRRAAGRLSRQGQNLCCQSLGQLRVELRKAKERLRRNKHVILGCIRQPGFEVWMFGLRSVIRYTSLVLGVVFSEVPTNLSRFSARSHTSLLVILVIRPRPDRGRGPNRRRYRVNQGEQTQERLAHHFTLRSHLQRGRI
jgi:Transposase IS116/IS110/IS902 family